MCAEDVAAERRAKRPYGRSRRDLAEAAIREFETRGFAATTVEDIAEAAGYSPRTFFRQFATKGDAVFFDLPDFFSRLGQLVAQPPPDAWGAVCSIIMDNSTNWEASGPELAQSRTRLIHREPELYLRFLQLADEWEDVIARVFAAETGGDPDTDVPARVLAAGVVGACRVALRVWSATPETSLVAHMRIGLDVIDHGR